MTIKVDRATEKFCSVMDPHEITAESLTFMGADFCEGLAVFKEICDLMLL